VLSRKTVLVSVLPALIGAGVGMALTLQFRPQPTTPVVLAPETPPETPPDISVIYSLVDMNALPGWTQDRAAEALPALQRSCRHFRRKTADLVVGKNVIARSASDWHAACDALRNVSHEEGLREVLTTSFSVYGVSANTGGVHGSRGTFTGYYEADLKGSLTRGGKYQTPIYGPPRNLVTVNLRDFSSSAAAVASDFSASLIGRVVQQERGGQLKPYYSRAEIDSANAIASDADVLVWAEDPVDVHILHIQGSGRVTLPDGHVIRIGFAGHNGHSFRGIGGILLKAGVLAPGQGSMLSVRDWLRRHPEQAAEYMNLNTRYIFFRRLDPAQTEDGPIGAFGVSLTPMRSIAVDPRFVPLGAPVWIDTYDPDGNPLQRLVSAQDVGSAIKGAVRGDFFWGAGSEAFFMAGRMKSEGQYFVFIPNEQNIDSGS
jgi:membrane-bound lytic murein transglycosylase A